MGKARNKTEQIISEHLASIKKTAPEIYKELTTNPAISENFNEIIRYAEINVMELENVYYGTPIHQKIINIPTGERMILGRHTLEIVEKIKALPASVRLEIIECSEIEIKDYLVATQKRFHAKAKELLRSVWYWKESGEVCEFIYPDLNERYFGFKLDLNGLLKKVQTGKIPLEQLKKIIDFFEGEKIEVYQKEI